jgi:hypothetical protein
MRRARSDLHLVLANMRVLFGLVMMQPSHVSDGATVDHLGAVSGHQGATIDCIGAATDRMGATANY